MGVLPACARLFSVRRNICKRFLEADRVPVSRGVRSAGRSTDCEQRWTRRSTAGNQSQRGCESQKIHERTRKWRGRGAANETPVSCLALSSSGSLRSWIGRTASLYSAAIGSCGASFLARRLRRDLGKRGEQIVDHAAAFGLTSAVTVMPGLSGMKVSPTFIARPSSDTATWKRSSVAAPGPLLLAESR
jgi:hypothetical protein